MSFFNIDISKIVNCDGLDEPFSKIKTRKNSIIKSHIYNNLLPLTFKNYYDFKKFDYDTERIKN